VRAVELANPGCTLAMETNGIGKVQVQNYRALYPGARIVEVKRASDKYAAAVGTATAWNAGRIAVPLGGPWVPDFVSQAQGFTGRPGAEDDDVDALVNGWEGGGAGGTSSGSVSL
jgi:predicted phage terminase large subunit-like protein